MEANRGRKEGMQLHMTPMFISRMLLGGRWISRVLGEERRGEIRDE